jgi:hypothetical protein
MAGSVILQSLVQTKASKQNMKKKMNAEPRGGRANKCSPRRPLCQRWMKTQSEQHKQLHTQESARKN